MRRFVYPLIPALALLIAMPAASATAAAFQQPEGEQEQQVYDENADAAEEIKAALETAMKENTRVLIQWGANWCGWCKKLHELFQSNRQISRKLLYEYEIVYVDIGRFDKNLDLAGRFGADLRANGVPFLTVLASDGTVITNQETGSLEVGDAHDPARVMEFLETHQADYLDAEVLLADAFRRAGQEEKRVFLTFGAPW